MKFHYKAFISYNHKDKRTAKGLQRRLEAFKIPKRIQKPKNLSKTLKPIFLDQTDMSSGDLEFNVRKELDDAEFLIVICSPNSAKSTWVEKEVRYFMRNNGTEKVIPFIVSGIPGDDENENCYPPSLSSDILGCSVIELGYQKAFIRLVARLVGVKFDELWQRHVRKRRRKRATISLSLAFILSSSAIYYDRFWRVKSSFYTDYTLKNLIPQGIKKLSNEEIKTRSFYYKFYRKAGQLVKIEHYNALGFLQSPNTIHNILRSPVLELKYQGGKLKSIIHGNQNGSTLKEMTVTRESKNEYTLVIQKDEKTMPLLGRIQSLVSNLYQKPSFSPNSSIDKIRLVMDANDRIQKKLFSKNNRRGKVGDQDGIFGIAYKYNSDGVITELSYLNEFGTSSINRLGITKMQFNYDSSGKLRFICNVGQNQSLVFNKSGWAKKEWSYYKNGNIREIRYYNRDQKLSFNDEGFSIAQFDYDKNGNRIAATYLDPYGKAVNTFGGYAHRKWHFKQLDDKSRTHIKATFYDEDLKPKKHLEGYAKILFLLDEKGNMIEQSFFGLDDKAVLFRSSFFRASVLRDKLGNPIEERYFGLDDALKENAYGFSIVKRQYETKLMVPISEAYYNKEGKACLSNQNKIHKWKSYYFDENFNYSGNLYAQAYFDTMLCLSKGKHGFAFLEMEKDPTDHQLKPLPILDMNSAYLHLQQYETLTKTQLGCMDSLDKTPY